MLKTIHNYNCYKFLNVPKDKKVKASKYFKAVGATAKMSKLQFVKVWKEQLEGASTLAVHKWGKEDVIYHGLSKIPAHFHRLPVHYWTGYKHKEGLTPFKPWWHYCREAMFCFYNSLQHSLQWRLNIRHWEGEIL